MPSSVAVSQSVLRPCLLALEDCTEAVAGQVGGKARGLNFLIGQALPVPAGFTVTTEAYRVCVARAGIEKQVMQLAASALTPGECEFASSAIRALFVDAILSADIAGEIAAAYRALDGNPDTPVAVRSSATAEDMAEASFAGQQDTYLHIRGTDAVLHHVVKCWASLYTAQAIGYRARLKVPHDDLAMAVVVQRMVDAETAGVMMSLEPTNGRRDCIYIEAALGLGEGVVRGDVGSDRYWVNKNTLALNRQQINAKQDAHRFDGERNEVRIVPVSAAIQEQPALLPEEIGALATMAKQAEKAFGAPVDMEWAIGPGTQGPRTVQLLQARAETVWSGRDPAASDGADEIGTLDDWDNLHNHSTPNLHWSTSNMGEAVPGVSTPLSWSLWGPVTDSALRGGAFAIGVLTSQENRVPPAIGERHSRIFFGRPAIKADYLAMVGDRMPGTTGQEVVRDIFGKVPETMRFAPTMRRYPAIAIKLPWNFLTAPWRTRRLAEEMKRWWRQSVTAAPTMDMTTAVRTLNSAAAKMHHSVSLQAAVLLGIVTPLYTALSALVAKTGVGDTAALSGFGGAEMDVVSDIWRASRGDIAIDDVLERHGFHGPLEGELSSVVWREDPSPLRRLIDDYAARDDQTDPRRNADKRRLEAIVVERRLLAAVTLAQRPFVWLVLKLAAKRIPLRGVSKRSFLQQIDVARACARRVGELLAGEGKLDKPEDVFYLTLEELSNQFPADAKTLVVRRRKRREAYAEVGVPSEWRGMPEPIRLADQDSGASAVVRGTGVSPGVVEGVARVLLTPDFGQVQPGDILVTPTTDPSWSSVMFISSALVVDIGGALSHAAIVARELGIPCVVNTHNGSRVLKSGMRLRVDGSKGTVEILDNIDSEGAVA